MLRSRRAVTLVVVAALASGVASAGLVRGILRGGATKFLVERHGDEVNDFMNKLSKNETYGRGYATKVVNVVSFGKGMRVGVVQVIGPQAQVARVRAVVQLEGQISLLDLRVRGLVPINNDRGIFTGVERVEGVGVSGIIDIDL